MHRRAQGGAWSVAALLIGSCTAVEAGEPPRMPTSYSSGAAAPMTNVSTFAPAGAATMPAAVPTPSAIDFNTNSGAMEIIATPFVPYASAHALRGPAASPAGVASAAPPPPISTSPATDAGRLVPIELSLEEKSLLEKVLRGVAVKQEAPAANFTAVADAQSEAKAPVDEKKPAPSVARDRGQPAARVPAEGKKVSITPTAAAMPKASEPSTAKITPLPPLDQEVPSTFKLPPNLPQPPIPLEFPRTGS